MPKKYSNCFYCGGQVEEQLMPREFKWKDKVFVLENVPVSVSAVWGKILKAGSSQNPRSSSPGEKKNA